MVPPAAGSMLAAISASLRLVVVPVGVTSTREALTFGTPGNPLMNCPYVIEVLMPA